MWKNNDKRRITEEITGSSGKLIRVSWNDGTTGCLGEGANYPEVQINIIKQKTKRI